METCDGRFSFFLASKVREIKVRELRHVVFDCPVNVSGAVTHMEVRR